MFKLEQEEYMREQINWTFIDFGMDSQDRIDLIDKKPIGILALLEEESFFPKATDETFLAKVSGAHSRNAYFRKPKFQKGTFRLAHYAGEVEYDVKGWLDKNRDPLQEDLEICMKRSKDPIIAELFSDAFKPTEEVTHSTSGRRPPTKPASSASGELGSKSRKGAQFVTVGTQYKEQLNDLMNTLYATNPHFVRCILPNHEKRPGQLEAEIVLDQLRCNGVLEGIRISRKGFPNRVVYAEFLKRYYLLNSSVNKNDPDPRKATEKILQGLKIDPEQYRFGLTKVFFRAGQLARIEELREQKIGDLIITIQVSFFFLSIFFIQVISPQ
jgi:myosin protein heavy chain